MRTRLAVFLVVAGFSVSACAAAASPSAPGGTASPGPAVSPSLGPSGTAPVVTESPSARPNGAITDVELKIRLVERFGPLWYCDPDYWPVAREDEAALAVQRWPEITADPVALAVIGRHLGIAVTSTPTDAQKLAIYRTWKVLRAIALEPAGADRNAFDYLAMPPGTAAHGTRSRGTINRAGTIVLTSALPAPAPVCPICLARGQLVETPSGPAAVQDLRVGGAVWTRGLDGGRLPGRVLALGDAGVPAGHEMVWLVLADGRALRASPGHPLADGRRLAALRAGDVVDGAVVVRAERVPYDEARTFDLLPSGPTGAYSVAGIWLASSLRP
jgi:hypothetical protein